MSKHRYQAKELQRFEWAQLAADVKGQRLVFSVDVAKENFYGAFMISPLEALGTIKWQHPGETDYGVRSFIVACQARWN